MLRPYRVLDCTDHRGHLAGFMLAQLGAEVVLVEPPAGSPARRRPPFARRVDGTDGPSLWHVAYNRGKRSVVVDPASDAGREELDRLLRWADIVLWSGRPSDLLFDPHQLVADHPALIVGTLTPFGLDGPKANWHDTDLTVAAAGCQLALTGDTDRPPLRCGIPQGYAHGAADLAVGVLYALNERGRSGRGQVVDVSAQAAYLQASFAYALNEAWDNAPLGRSGEGINVGPFKLRWGYPAADGEVSITLLFGAAFKEFTPQPVPLDLGGGRLRRSHPGQAVGGPHRPAVRRPGTGGGARPPGPHRGRPHRHPDQGRADRGIPPAAGCCWPRWPPWPKWSTTPT